MGLPSGTVTFLFADIEGSTRLARTLSGDDWADLLERHDRLVDGAVHGHGGVIVKHEGDGTFASFSSAVDAVAAAVAIAAALIDASWPAGASVRVRIGLHTGEGRRTSAGNDYVGVDVHYAARIAAAANGGQIVLSEATRDAAHAALPEGVALVSVGPRRVKDFDEPRPIHRLVVAGVADDDRPLRLGTANDLPPARTAFVGRDDEVAAVVALVRASPVVTLTGPGGSGKTRLALRVADAVRGAFPDGLAFVELAPVTDPARVVDAVAAAIGVHEAADRPIRDAVRAWLADHRALLVVDNVEHLLPTASLVLSDLLGGASTRLLVTSREPLRISGEQEHPVPPLASADGRALFLDRARLVRPDLQAGAAESAAIDRIVARLAGMPLAIELAAARSKLFGPSELLARLERSFDILGSGSRDAPARQRTLHDTIAWSHDLLDDDERTLFRRLSVLAGDWTSDVAVAIADPDGDLTLDVLDGISSLVDKSLIRVVPSASGDAHFGWHAFVREFAATRLSDAGERDQCERRHAAAFRALAMSVAHQLTEVDADRALDAVDHSIHDLRLAMAWALANGEPAVGLDIVGAVWRWWQLRTMLAEGREWADRLLRDPAAGGDSPSRVAGLAASGGLAYWSMDYAATKAAYLERLAIAERLGDPRLLAEAHYDLGFVGMVERDVDFLRREGEQAIALFRQVGDGPGIVRARQALVLAHFLTNDPATARALEEENLADFRRTQSWYRISDSLMLLGAILRQAGEPEQALVRIREGIRSLPERIGGSTVAALAAIAIIEGESGDAELAARLTGAIRAIQSETGEALAPVAVLHLPDPVDVVRERLGTARADDLMAEGALLSPAAATTLALGPASPNGV